MRSLLLAIVVAALPAVALAGDLFDLPKSNQAVAPDRQLPVKRSAGGAGACAVYGRGFVKVDGTDTCVKLSGSVRVDVGASR